MNNNIMNAILMPGDRKLNQVQLPIPDLLPNQILLKNRAAGLCGSDLHLFYRPPAAERDGYMFGLKLDSKIVPGHEGAGDVYSIGSAVNNLKKGDRVAVAHVSGCGYCISCRRGWDVHCVNKTTYALDRHGFMSDYTVVDAKDCVKLPENISYMEGAFWGCGAGTAWSAINRMRLPLGSTVGIIGLGPVGAAAVLVAKHLGLRVIGFDPVSERRDFAIQMGADICIDPKDKQELSKHLDKLDATLEASGSSAGRNLALGLIRVWGKAAFVGFADDSTAIDFHLNIIEKQAEIHGVWLFTTPDLQEFINEASKAGLSFEKIFSNKHTMEDVKSAVEKFDKGSSGKTMFYW